MRNPMTGDIMVKQKKKVICYKLSENDMNGITKAYSSKYDICDASDCFEDILAISASMVFINPDKLSKDQFDLLKIYFTYENNASVIFSSEPHISCDFMYYIDENLAEAQISWKNEYDKEALADKLIDNTEE